MKGKLFIFGVVTLFLIGGVFASEGQNDTKREGNVKEEISHSKTESSVVEVGNTICPVSGMEIGNMGDPVKYEYEGKIYNFYSTECIDKFKADPEKYIKIIEESKDINIKGSHGHGHEQE